MIPRIAILIGFLATLSGAFFFSAKQAFAVHVAISCAALAAAIWFAIRASKLSAWAALGSLALAAFIGWIDPTEEVWHAIFAHMFVGFAAVSLVSTGKAAAIIPSQWKAIRPAAQIMPYAVFTQIAMGAMYRHQVTGIIPHMLGAIIVTLLALVVSVIIIQHLNQSPDMKNGATALMTAVLFQIVLGITTFIMQLLETNTTPVFAWISSAHVTVGSMVLAASVVVALEVRKSFGADS